MPTLMRFLTVVILLACIGGAGMVYLAYFVTPKARELTVRIPAEKLVPEQVTPPPAAPAPPPEASEPESPPPAGGAIEPPKQPE